MSRFIVTWAVAWILCLGALRVAGSKTPISQSLLENFKRYAQFSSAAYAKYCLVPPQGSKVIGSFEDTGSNTQGFYAIDDSANELIVAVRGTDNLPDLMLDFQLGKVPLKAFGEHGCRGCKVSPPILRLSPTPPEIYLGSPYYSRCFDWQPKVHQGFMRSWNSVAKEVVGRIKDVMYDNPDIKVTLTGHSLGGAVAALAALSCIGSGINVTTYTFGQPRTGNQAFADYVDRRTSPDTMFRVTHANDGVPQLLFPVLGYRHHSTEYWQQGDDVVAAKTFKCSGQDSKECNGFIPGVGINAAHLRYMGMPTGRPDDRGATACKGRKPAPPEVAAALLGA